MKKIFFGIFVVMFAFSCESVKDTAQTQNDSVPEIWEEGISTLTGIITNVVQEKDGQTITLKATDGIDYSCVISIPNLGKNHEQYREFRVGENITFRGNLSNDNRMTVIEVLENR
ncbi:MAG: hypothetical protein WBA59_06415 [Moheibacter sp.]